MIHHTRAANHIPICCLYKLRLSNLNLLLIPQRRDCPQQTHDHHAELYSLPCGKTDFRPRFLGAALKDQRGDQSSGCTEQGAKNQNSILIHSLFPS